MTDLNIGKIHEIIDNLATGFLFVHSVCLFSIHIIHGGFKRCLLTKKILHEFLHGIPLH